MHSYKKLWEIQLQEWPNSVRLKPYQLLHWAMLGTQEQRITKLMHLALTTQHSRVVFYLTDRHAGHIGARFGLNGGDYISGFGDYLATLEGDRLVDTRHFA